MFNIDKETRKVIIDGMVYGTLSYQKNVSKKTEGWLFIPATTSHRAGRVLHQTMEGVVPAWVKRAGK